MFQLKVSVQLAFKFFKFSQLKYPSSHLLQFNISSWLNVKFKGSMDTYFKLKQNSLIHSFLNSSTLHWCIYMNNYEKQLWFLNW